jgi:hypothetical protein
MTLFDADLSLRQVRFQAADRRHNPPYNSLIAAQSSYFLAAALLP